MQGAGGRAVNPPQKKKTIRNIVKIIATYHVNKALPSKHVRFVDIENVTETDSKK